MLLYPSGRLGGPLGVKHAVAIHATVGMRAEEIALRLGQVRRQPLRAIGDALIAGTGMPRPTAVCTT